MKKFLLILLLPVLIFSITPSEILEKWKSSEYVAFRFFVEESKFPKMRYEKVYKKGDDKLVFVLNPKEMVWFRKDDKTWMGNKTLYVVPSGIKDLEDVAMEALESSTNATVVEGDGWYLLQYEGEKGYFEVEIDQAGIPSRIYRKIDGVEMKMTIEVTLEENFDFEELLKGKKLSDEPAFPEELGRIMSVFDWFAVKESEGLLEIEGIVNGKWHEVIVGFEKFDDSVEFGNIYLKGDPEVLKLIESNSD